MQKTYNGSRTKTESLKVNLFIDLWHWQCSGTFVQQSILSSPNLRLSIFFGKFFSFYVTYSIRCSFDLVEVSGIVSCQYFRNWLSTDVNLDYYVTRFCTYKFISSRYCRMVGDHNIFNYTHSKCSFACEWSVISTGCCASVSWIDGVIGLNDLCITACLLLLQHYKCTQSDHY